MGSTTDQFDDDGDDDWHLFVGPSDCFGAALGGVRATIDEDAELCAFIDCAEGTVACSDGSAIQMRQGFFGCCTELEQVQLLPFACAEASAVLVSVSPVDRNAQACMPYTVTINQ